MDKEFDGVCLFCGKTGIDIAHMSACSFEDAKKKLVERDDGIGVNALTHLFNAVLMVKTYENALPEDRALMYFCRICGGFDMATKIPPICPSCSGLHTTTSASKYIEELMTS